MLFHRGFRTLIILFILAAFSMSAPPPALAQETDPAVPAAGDEAPAGTDAAAAEVQEEMDIFTLLWKGGWVMIPIALASVLALTITIERFISLRRRKVIPPEFITGLKNLFQKDEVDADIGMHYCRQHPSVLSNLIESGFPKIRQGERPLQQALEDAGAREVDRMKRSLKPLSMIATVSPLLGLLGTVYGMIGAFQAATQAGLGKSDVLAQGIYEALVTTAAGLTLAIPVIIIYQLLNHRVDAMVDDLDANAEEFMALALNSGGGGAKV